MRFINECQECARLWREYSNSTTEHIRLESKLKIAALARDADELPALTLGVEEAAARRARDRDAIKVHEAAAHPPTSSAETAT